MYSTVAGLNAVGFLEGTIGSGKSALAVEAQNHAEALGFTIITASDLGSLTGDGLLPTGPGPYFLLAENLHEATETTRALLRRLIDDDSEALVFGAPLFLLATSAPTLDPLSRTLARMAEHTGSRVTLRGLLRQELDTLLRVHRYDLSKDQLSTIYGHSSGNPGLALQLAHAERRGQGDEFAALIVEQLRPELDRLTPQLRTFLEVLALKGRACRPMEAANITEQALRACDAEEPAAVCPGALIDALRPILAGNGDEVTLVDHAWRAAAVRLIEPERRHKLHMLLAENSTGITRARHLTAASPEGDAALADEWEKQSRRALEAGDYSTSAIYLALAVAVSRGETRKERLILAGLTIALSGTIPSVIDIPEEIQRLHDYPAAATMLRAGIAYFDGDTGAARTMLLTWLRESDGQITPPAVLMRWRMLILLCSVELAAADEVAALKAADDARLLDVKPMTCVDEVLARVLALHETYALWNNGRVQDSIGRLDVFLTNSIDTAEHADALYLRGRAHFYAGDSAAALGDLDRAELARHQKVVPAAAQRGMGEQAMIEFHLGRWTDATLRAEQVISMATTNRDGRGVASSRAVLAMVAAAHADDGAAQRHMDWLVRRMNTSTAMPLHNVITGLAVTARTMGDPERVLEVIATFRRTRLGTWAEPVGLNAWRALEIEALLDLDGADGSHRHEAERFLSTFSHKAARRPGLPLFHGHPLALSAKLSVLRGDLDAALDQYHGAIRLAAEFPHTRGRLHHALGLTHRERGEHHDAHDHLMAARNTFTQLGAVRELSAVESRLLLVSGHYATLTAREQDIAYLISQRHTNREIAETLFVSVKTVEYHVSNLLPKLGMSSRRELWNGAAPSSSPATLHSRAADDSLGLAT